MARSPAKRIVGTLLFAVAVLITVGFLFILYASAANDTDFPLADREGAVALVTTIVLALIAVALLLMLLIRRIEASTAKAESGEVFFVPESPPPARRAAATTEFESVADLAVYDLRKVPQANATWGPGDAGAQAAFYFPRNLTGGVYVNDYIPVAPGKVLKLRTLMAGPYDPAYEFTASPGRAKATRAKAAERVVAAATKCRQSLVLQEAATTPAAPQETYYDYDGDVHDVEDLEGIGPTYGERLRKLGVHTTGRLAYEDTASLAERMQLPRRTVEQWKHMAELIKVSGIGPQYAEALVRAGIEGIAELKRRSPAKIAEQVNAYLDTLDTNVLGNKITEKRVEGWQDKAKPMKRIRLAVPAQ
jgi:predicted flap endonuclease-1-like 5' DNA nuclease